MPYYDNPAGRLHELFRRLHEQDPNATILSAWSKVLGVPQPDVVLYIGGVANLIRGIQEAVGEMEDEFMQAPVMRLRDTWARPVFPQDVRPIDPLANVLLQDEPMQTLGLVAGQLHLRASEGSVPDDDKLVDLLAQLHELADSVREATDLADDVKAAIIARLRDVELAIRNVKVGGPEVVRRATESVMGTVFEAAAADRATARSPSTRRVVALALVVVAVFKGAPAMQASIEAVDTMVEEITTGQVIRDGASTDDSDDTKPPTAKTPEANEPSP